jgi:hypothetical protein
MKKFVLLITVFTFVLMAFGPDGAKPVQSASPTFNKEVVRIFQQNCQACHHPGYIAPFSLIDFQDAKNYAPAIKDAVQARRMPPWKAAPDCGDFHDARVLSSNDIETITKWVDAGAPEGNPEDLPPRLSFPDGWSLGQPDIELKSPEKYEVTGNTDVYRCFCISNPSDQDQYVTAAEVLPDQTSLVHHVLLYLDGKGDSAKLDAADPGPGYSCFGGPGFVPVGGLGGWAPGNFPRFAPKGLGMKIPKGSKVVMQVHYFPNGETKLDQTRVGLHLAKEPIESNIMSAPIVNFSFLIPPGKARHKVVATGQVPPGTNIKLIGVTPHMHLLGTQIKLEATLPGGKKQCLVNIPKWDFQWQGTYTYKEPITLPGGTKLKLTTFYDNSLKNPRNPSNPPKAVHWGERTTDEMCLAFINFIVDRGKTSITADSFSQSQMEQFIGPPIMMNGVNLTEQSLVRFQSALFSSSPNEMYNWSQGYSKKDLTILPWHKSDPQIPNSAAQTQEKQHCH